MKLEEMCQGREYRVDGSSSMNIEALKSSLNTLVGLLRTEEELAGTIQQGFS